MRHRCGLRRRACWEAQRRAASPRRRHPSRRSARRRRQTAPAVSPGCGGCAQRLFTPPAASRRRFGLGGGGAEEGEEGRRRRQGPRRLRWRRGGEAPLHTRVWLIRPSRPRRGCARSAPSLERSERPRRPCARSQPSPRGGGPAQRTAGAPPSRGRRAATALCCRVGSYIVSIVCAVLGPV